MDPYHPQQRQHGGVKAGILLWLIGLPLGFVLLGFLFC